LVLAELCSGPLSHGIFDGSFGQFGDSAVNAVAKDLDGLLEAALLQAAS
jgi:hypothetical protein